MKKSCAAIMMALGLTAAAQADDYKFDFGIGHTIVKFDWGDERLLDNDDGRFLTAAYNVDEEWAFELFYADLDTKTDITGIDVNANQLGLKGLYHFTDRSNGLVPYMGVGFAELELDGAHFDKFSEFGLVYVLGAKLYLTDRIALRLEANFDRFEESHDNDQGVWIGLNVGFGNVKKVAPASPAPMAAPTPEPIPEPAQPVAPPSIPPPPDSDKDGVIDAQDKCPGTPAGLTVNNDGCATLTEKVSIQLQVNFDSGKADVKDSFAGEIQKVVDFMNQYPTTKVIIEGHTDASGDDKKNKALSQRRADSVAAAIVKAGVAADRVSAVGHGEEKPVADNATVDGRAQNRRVTAEIEEQITTRK